MKVCSTICGFQIILWQDISLQLRKPIRDNFNFDLPGERVPLNSWFDDKISVGSLIRFKSKSGIWLFLNTSYSAVRKETDFTCLFLGIDIDRQQKGRYVKILMDQLYFIIIDDYYFTEQKTEVMVQVEILSP